MKLGNRLPVDVGVVLVAGMTMALSGCTPSAVMLAALSAPVAAASPAQSVSAHSAPSAATLVAAHSVPVTTPNLPVVHCMDIPTPNPGTAVGTVSVPHCVVFESGREAIGDHSAPVAAASVPQCVEVPAQTATTRC